LSTSWLVERAIETEGPSRLRNIFGTVIIPFFPPVCSHLGRVVAHFTRLKHGADDCFLAG
jgi:hypothetical protein